MHSGGLAAWLLTLPGQMPPGCSASVTVLHPDWVPHGADACSGSHAASLRPAWHQSQYVQSSDALLTPNLAQPALAASVASLNPLAPQAVIR